jgi:hypothetical protein
MLGFFDSHDYADGVGAQKYIIQYNILHMDDIFLIGLPYSSVLRELFSK